jgi:hypothetical protein
VYNVTYTVALYALLLFYMGTHELLRPFRPLLKFVLVKSVVFMTYWQVRRGGKREDAGWKERECGVE